MLLLVMSDWADIYQRVANIARKDAVGVLFFRGHSDSSWPLLPGLARTGKTAASNLGFDEFFKLESSIYARFVTRAGDLLRDSADSWANLFAMQHHGLPTRLLDWSRTFSVALYFALLNAGSEAAVWILDPYDLNERTRNSPGLIEPSDLPGTYAEYYLDRTMTLGCDVAAISPIAHSPRVFSQRAAFTLHDNLEDPLETLHPQYLTKVRIPATAYDDAWQFLHLAGISEFTLFPDLDGLAREIRHTYFAV